MPPPSPPKDRLKLQGPVEVQVVIGIVHEASGATGELTLGLTKGVYPTEGQIRDAVEEGVAKHMPDGCRLMSKQEYWDAMCIAATGQKFALPGGRDWDD